MNLKEFNAKQFLLEKGEQVGLGIALTLMVLMLIFSLFMPSKGFFSGSPATQAKTLTEGTEKLQRALGSRPLPDNYKPPATEGRLIDLETDPLQPRFYPMSGYFFTPSAPENPDRRPPEIFNLVEAKAAAIHVPIDTYMFSRDYKQILTLEGQGSKNAPPGAPGGRNSAVANMYGRAMQGRGMMGGSPSMPGGGASASYMQRTMQRFPGGANSAGANVLGANEKEDYTTKWVPLTNLSGSEHLARQLQPARMAIIEGSFPYKNQLLEFQRKLHLSSIQDVLNETMKVETDKDQTENLSSFRFLGIEVERKEVDAAGKTVKEWEKIDLGTPYKVWLMNSGMPFESDDPKYDPITDEGLVMPRLRQFHADNQPRQTSMMMSGMMPPGMSPPGGAPPGFRPPGMAGDEAPKPGESKYPDLAKDLKTINDTLSKLTDVSPKKIARVPDQFRGHEGFNPFSRTLSTPAAEGNRPPTPEKVDQGDTVPEYYLVRLVDLSITPGKYYRYRFKVKMANPNYGRDDVASTSYKTKKELISSEWKELDSTISVPPETIYYVVDQKQVTGKQRLPRESPQTDMWRRDPSRDQVVFQLHRWIDSAPIAKNSDAVPIGEWALADRVFLSRGDYVGQTVKVDLPIWKYTQDAYVLPAEDQTRKEKKIGRTGVFVNFGEENPDSQTILIDFEGGKESLAKINDNSTLEVLMLSPDGKLRARNSAEDASDKERQDRREKVQKRIQDIREGKSGEPSGAGGGLDPSRGR